MPTQQDRIDTIVALLNSNPAIIPTNFRKLKSEFEQVIAVNILTPMTRKNLVKILHSTRALDTTLQILISHYGLAANIYSLGPLIDKFSNHTSTRLGTMTRVETNRFKRSIADVRNKHLHNAGSYPRDEGEVYQLISEMEALITRVLAL